MIKELKEDVLWIQREPKSHRGGDIEVYNVLSLGYNNIKQSFYYEYRLHVWDHFYF